MRPRRYGMRAFLFCHNFWPWCYVTIPHFVKRLGGVAIGKPERQVLHTVAVSNNRDHPTRSLSSSPKGSAINYSPDSQALSEVTNQDHSIGITLLLLVRTTDIRVLFFAHIPFVVNHTFNATPNAMLQQWSWHYAPSYYQRFTVSLDYLPSVCVQQYQAANRFPSLF